LSSFHTYTKEDISKIRTLTPSIAKNKISGKMHEETYYGIKKVGNTTYKTIRKSLENIKRSDLENIPDKKGGSKDIYNTILAWFGDCQTGEEALKLHNGKYPISQNDKENKEIKKIKVYSEYKNTGHIINGSNVEKGGIYKIDVLKSKEPEDEKLYFAAYDILEINKIKAINSGSKEDFNIKLDYGQSKNNIILSYSNMLKNFDILCSLYKNDLVDITLRNGKQSTAYIVGCSSGMLEVKSKLGDGYDIIGENSLFNKERAQYQITVSTIKSIKKLSISILGEINGV
jgi:hypothetical protein